MIKCHSCGKEYDESANFCPNCGAASTVSSVRCPNCGKEYDGSANFCPNCGASNTLSPINSPKERAGSTANGFATASLILGIVSLIGLLVPLVRGIPTLLCADLAIYFGIFSKKRLKKAGRPTSKATVGIVLGIISIVITVIILLLIIGLIALFSSVVARGAASGISISGILSGDWFSGIADAIGSIGSIK